MAEGEEQEMSKMVQLYPNSVEVNRGVKGGYGWTVKLRFPFGKTPAEMAASLADLDRELKAKFEPAPAPAIPEEKCTKCGEVHGPPKDANCGGKPAKAPEPKKA